MGKPDELFLERQANVKARCKFCDWMERATGVYDSHFRSRAHMKLHHPTDFAVLEAGEARIRQIYSQLSEQFGQALKPKNMN